jgi:hypothetical protein
MIVLLNGMSRSGKDTVAALFEKHGFQHKKISAHVKHVVCAMFGLTADELEDHRKDLINKEYLVTPRDLMKFVGTHVGQYEMQRVLPSMGRTFWIHRLVRDLQKDEKYVISDYRFPHEYVTLQQQFPSVPLVRVRVQPQFPGFVPPNVFDETERPLAYDYIIHNETLDQLAVDVDAIVKKILVK